MRVEKRFNMQALQGSTDPTEIAKLKSSNLEIDMLLQKITGDNQRISGGSVGGELTKDKAMEFMKQAGGDKEKARQLAREQGYSF